MRATSIGVAWLAVGGLALWTAETIRRHAATRIWGRDLAAWVAVLEATPAARTQGTPSRLPDSALVAIQTFVRRGVISPTVRRRAAPYVAARLRADNPQTRMLAVTTLLDLVDASGRWAANVGRDTALAILAGPPHRSAARFAALEILARLGTSRADHALLERVARTERDAAVRALAAAVLADAASSLRPVP